MIGAKAFLQGIPLDIVEADNPKRTVDVTTKPVEDGVDVSDHVKQNPQTLSIKGYLHNPDAWARMKQLESLMTSGTLV